MSIKVGKYAGFCFGVDRAVNLVYEAVNRGERVFTLGPIIHNRHMVERFASLGVKVLDHASEAVPGTTVVIRAHGVPREEEQLLRNAGVKVVDATCPFVKRIHKLVSEAEAEGRTAVVIGSRSHPEIVGISSWCPNGKVFETPEELEKWAKDSSIPANLPICMVSQTTLTANLWDLCVKIAKKEFTNPRIFDTICRATEYRQNEAEKLSEVCQAMVVVGDPKSSNTNRLAMICREHCPKVTLVGQASELDPAFFDGVTDVGITAGASTPAWIIKEVNYTMSEITTVETGAEQSFEEMLEQSIKTLNTGDKVLGVVTHIGTTEVSVDLGTKHAGYIPCDEVSADPNLKPEDVLKVGDEIEVFVVRVNDQEGTCQLSKKKLDGIRIWDEINAACENKTTIEAPIVDENKGGLVANVKGTRVFIPASQTGVARGGDLGVMVGQTVKMRITEVNRARRRVIGSIRAVSAEARKAAAEKIWAEIEEGKKYHGVVKSMTSFGAFVDIGGVDGMVHVTQLSWGRIRTPGDVVKVGDEIDVFVLSFDAEKRKISLGYKTAEMNPWVQFAAKYNVGDVVEAKVVKLMTFGAFAEIMPGIDGLIHISQLADRRVAKPEEIVTEGQDVTVKIIDIDLENKRISLSIRALLGGETETVEEPEVETEEPAVEE